MRPLRYSINVILDGCCDHRAIIPDEDLHRHAVENIEQTDALYRAKSDKLNYKITGLSARQIELNIVN